MQQQELSTSNLDADLEGIISLARRHIQIRNRSWMKRVHRDSFIGSDLVDFLLIQGLADTRKLALEMCRKMVSRGFVKQITEHSSSLFADSYHYYRFREDDSDASLLAHSGAGNGNGIHPGHGGCKFSFAPHTAHNSFIMDIALAEEIERSVAGASIQARAHAMSKLRARVREQAEANAPDWTLSQSVSVNETKISVFQRTRPRGNWKNVKMTGMVGKSAPGFVGGIISFRQRKHWESMFEDGIVVENIDTGEAVNELITAELDDMKKVSEPSSYGLSSPLSSLYRGIRNLALPDNLTQKKAGSGPPLARTTDDVVAFLQTVDLAGVPHAMAIAFLNDPERQHALAHLRKQMMLSKPQECMLCQTGFDNPSNDIRFCPCCAMVCCASCVCKRVFEVVSRTVVSICLHCFRESSRVRLPPQAVLDSSTIDESLRGKWWRPEELGLVDYSQSSHTSGSSSSTNADLTAAAGTEGLYNEEDMLIVDHRDLTPLIPGLMDPTRMSIAPGADLDDDDDDDEPDDPVSPMLGPSEKSGLLSLEVPIEAPFIPISRAVDMKTATCKQCGALISRDMEAIDAHMEECSGTSVRSGKGGLQSTAGLGQGGPVLRNKNSPSILRQKNWSADPRSYVVNETDGTIIVSYSPGSSKTFAGFLRRFEPATLKDESGTPTSGDGSEGNLSNTRIIYRTASGATGQTGVTRPREVAALQDCFVDADGSCYVYEISVRHCEARGLPDYVTADVMCLLYVARPIKGSKNMCEITIISQVDTRSKNWNLLSFLPSSKKDGSNAIGMVGKDDLIRELKQCGNLQNILRNEQDSSDDLTSMVSLEDFELLAVLGRGGFGKVMQVKYKKSGFIYAMKILKKSELRRRRQVERTQTERTILANVRHPFIVCLHFAFQSPQKLYMVMDFVQGGDFFTLMRKFKRLPEDWARLYTMEIAMALQHLHSMDVVYRDLKPENILLSLDGHLKLTDFGLSRFFETRPPAAEDMVENSEPVTRSFCGTEQYMSPEMLLQQGHNYRMDWWCLGLLMHEMISARHPFHGNSHYDTLRNMVTKPPNIDSKLSPAAANLVKLLLVKNPRARLCCRPENKGRGIVEMKSLPFFHGVDWDQLLNKQIKMPYIPNLASDADISFFESTFTKERPVDSIINLESDTADGKNKKKGKAGVFSGLFGLGSGKKADGDLTAADISDSFKGFSFTKESDDLTESSETITGATATNNNNSSGTTPTRPPTIVHKM